MLRNVIALVVVVAAVASAEPCGFCGGYLPSAIAGYELNGGYGSRVLNVGCTTPVVSAFPPCSPVATPSAIFDAAIAAPTAVTPIISTPVVSSGIFSSGLFRSLNGCGNDVLASVY